MDGDPSSVPEIAANKRQIRQEPTAAVLQVDALLDVSTTTYKLKTRLDFVTHLLRVSSDVLEHIELDILQGRALRDLPMNGAHISRLVGASDIYLEVLDTAQKVVGV
jgi:hypothetical protein